MQIIIRQLFIIDNRTSSAGTTSWAPTPVTGLLLDRYTGIPFSDVESGLQTAVYVVCMIVNIEFIDSCM